MTVKEKILTFFESNKGKYFSGEELAGQFGVSRAAVWKAVRALQGDGYPIDGVTGLGYRMAEETDILSKQGIEKYLTSIHAEEIRVVPVTGSTNADVKIAAQNGAAEGYTVIAAEQTSGSGRRGRSFFSPSGTGVYISVLLRPENCTPEIAMRITTIAAVAACKAIEDCFEEEEGKTVGTEPNIKEKTVPGIKWVNDVYLRGRKVCGILTEASFSMETGFLDYAVMGIGFNVYEPDGGFPADIAEKAGPVFLERTRDAKNRLTGLFLNYFFDGYHGILSKAYAEDYKKRSIVIGKEIRVLTGTDYDAGPDAGKRAKALDIDDDCRLFVRYEDGTEEWLASGEISIRPV